LTSRNSARRERSAEPDYRPATGRVPPGLAQPLTWARALPRPRPATGALASEDPRLVDRKRSAPADEGEPGAVGLA
jgi:hypothetical protein